MAGQLNRWYCFHPLTSHTRTYIFTHIFHMALIQWNQFYWYFIFALINFRKIRPEFLSFRLFCFCTSFSQNLFSSLVIEYFISSFIVVKINPFIQNMKFVVSLPIKNPLFTHYLSMFIVIESSTQNENHILHISFITKNGLC